MLKQVLIAAMLGCTVPNSTAALPGPSKGPSLTQQKVPLQIIHCEPIAVVMWHGEPKMGLFCVAEPPVQVFPSELRFD